jgi:carboxyl-terminal processing protease
MTAKQAAVEHQLAANRYVGIGIALTQNGGSHQIGAIIPDGPAAIAEIAPGELIVEVDGTKTDGLTMNEVIDRLRGPEGTTVTLALAHAAKSKSRIVTLTRSVIPLQTVNGLRQSDPESSVIDGDVPVAYLKINEIGGSTVSELRDHEAHLAAKKVHLLVLDLRGTGGYELRHAITLADALVDGGRSGMIRSRDRVTSVPFDRDCLFREWGMVVLVDNSTHGYAEWLAGLLQSRREAILVGQRTTGSWRFVFTTVELPDNGGMMRLATAVLEQGEPQVGRPFRLAGQNTAQRNARSLLFRTTAPDGNEFHIHSVTPNFEVESPPPQVGFAGGQPPDILHSPILARAIKALTTPTLPKESSAVEIDP